ncbi:MAG: NAD-binding protein [Kiritimatiellae bacterium]|nr:NAD-binding protein [Kiritimatiellia bacterium]
MKVIIVGAGFTGVRLARSLADSGAEVALVENDPDKARVAREQLDCAIVEADGNSPATLAAAGLADAGALVALTGDDEVNLITCALADAAFPGVRKLARVRNYTYYENAAASVPAGAMRRDGRPRPVFGVDRMLNPDVEAAAAISRAIEHGVVGNVIALDGGRGVVELAIAPASPLAGAALRDLPAKTGRRMLVAWVEKPDGELLPDGATTLAAGDRIGVVTDEDDLPALSELAGTPPEETPRRVAVFGAGLIGRFVAERLLNGVRNPPGGFFARFGGGRRRREVALVDPDPDRCREAARLLPGVRVLCGDVTEDSFLRDEGLDACDLAVTASTNYDGNLVAAAYLKSRGVGRTVALTAGAAFDPVARKLGIDVAVPLSDAVVDAIAGHLRGRNIRAVHSVCNRRFEIVECGIAPDSPAAGRPLRTLSLPGEYLLLLVSQPDAASFEVPSGDTVLRAGGRAVLVMRAGSRRVPRLFGGD